MAPTSASRLMLALVLVAASPPASGADGTGPVEITPAPPTAASAAKFPATTSYLTLAATFPTASIAAQLEAAIPRTFHFDTTSDGWRVYGTPSRGDITVATDPTNRRVTASTPVSGRIQVEKRVVIDLLLGKIDQVASVGIDISGSITVSISPEISQNWDVNPQLSMSADVNRAVAKTFLGDIDITGHVRGPVAGAVTGARGDVESRLKGLLDLRASGARLWGEINGVRKLSDSPATWLRITPKQATFGGFVYTPGAIESALALDLEARAFVQDEAPVALPSALPPLRIAGSLGQETILSLPVEISHETVNRRLKAELTQAAFDLPGDTSLRVIDATLSSSGDKALLTVDFRAKGVESRSATGRLYLVGVPVLDAGKNELRLTNLTLTSETRSALKEHAGWIAEVELADSMDEAVVIKLDDELARARDKANEQLAILKKQLPREFAVGMNLTELRIDRLALGKDRTFALVTARGQMSAVLRP